MYMSKANRNRAKRFGVELKIVEELQKRLKEGDGWCNITMKEDGQEIVIDLCYGGKYHATFPCYYGDSDYNKGKMPYRYLDEWFDGLDEIAEFLMRKQWQKAW